MILSQSIVSAEIPPTQNLDKTLRKSISYPDFAKNERLFGIVRVEFDILQNGSIEVVNMNTSHPNLGEYVKAELEQIRIDDISEVGKHFIKINFRYVEI